MKKILLLLFMACPLLARSQGTGEDWARFGKYAEVNKALTAKPKAVLMGDSIFELWASLRPQFFADNNFAGRGISGQTTSQILVRMMEDVVKIGPEYVVILCGINDIALNVGHAPDVRVAAGNVRAMVEIAKANKIRPVLCTLLPSHRIGWRPEVTDTMEQVREFNALIQSMPVPRKSRWRTSSLSLWTGKGKCRRNIRAMRFTRMLTAMPSWRDS